MQYAVVVREGDTDGEIAGRGRAFRVAITPLIDVAFRVMRHLGVEDREIDDALQTVLVAAERQFDALQNPQELKAYVCTACVSVARDVGRRRRRDFARSRAIDDVPEPSTSDPNPEDVLGRKQALELVQRLLQTIDEERRVVFVLYELEELTGQEIARHLGIPLGTVASRLRKAREEFREAALRVHATERLGRHGR